MSPHGVAYTVRFHCNFQVELNLPSMRMHKCTRMSTLFTRASPFVLCIYVLLTIPSSSLVIIPAIYSFNRIRVDLSSSQVRVQYVCAVLWIGRMAATSFPLRILSLRCKRYLQVANSTNYNYHPTSHRWWWEYELCVYGSRSLRLVRGRLRAG